MRGARTWGSSAKSSSGEDEQVPRTPHKLDVETRAALRAVTDGVTVFADLVAEDAHALEQRAEGPRVVAVDELCGARAVEHAHVAYAMNEAAVTHRPTMLGHDATGGGIEHDEVIAAAKERSRTQPLEDVLAGRMAGQRDAPDPVSYTHLTLPTIYPV